MLRLERHDLPLLPNRDRLTQTSVSFESLFDGCLHSPCHPVAESPLVFGHTLSIDLFPGILTVHHYVSTSLSLGDQQWPGCRVVKQKPAIGQRQVERPEIHQPSPIPSVHDLVGHIMAPFFRAKSDPPQGQTRRSKPYINQYNSISPAFQIPQKWGKRS